MARGQRDGPGCFVDLQTTEIARRSRNRGGARSPGFPSCVPVSGWAVAVVRSGDPRPQSSGTDAPPPPPTVAENDGSRVGDIAKPTMRKRTKDMPNGSR